MLNLDLELKKKYISPIEDNQNHYIGVEFEIPIVNLKKHPVDYNVIHELTKSFMDNFDFMVLHTDNNGNAYSIHNKTTGDNLSFDFCYSNLELSMGKEYNLNILYDRFLKYYNFIQDFLKPYEYTLTGMGINPYYKINHNTPIDSGRYQMLYGFLSSYKKHQGIKNFHSHPNYGAFTSASQVQLDVNQDNLIEVINTFNRLEPIKSVLFSNSYTEEYPELLCTRDMFWTNSMHGFNSHNVGIHEYKIKNIQDLINYIKSSSIYCVERNEDYIFFEPIQIDKYFNLKEVAGYCYQNGKIKTIAFTPKIEDLQYLRTFKFQDLTYRGTIEFRSVCCQPIRDIMSVSAFHIGLIENLNKLSEVLENDTIIYQHGYSTKELRNLFNCVDFPQFVNKNELSNLLIKILDISKIGLINRGMGEEKFLNSLYTRAENLSNPAKELYNGLKNGQSLEDYILKYSKV